VTIEVICTPYGPAATQRLAEQVEAHKGGDPLAPVTVVVPTNVAGLGARRALGAMGRGIAAVDFLKLFDLAERLVGRQMAMEFGRKPLSSPVLSATVRSVLNADPGLFQASAHHPATEQALVQSYRHLRELSEEQLDTLASQSRRAADVVRIYREVKEALKPQWYDEHDLTEQAINALRSGSLGDVLQGFGPVIIHLPQRVTRSPGRMVTALAQAKLVTVIVGLTGNQKADAAVVESVSRMGAALGPRLETSPSHGQRIITTASVDEEVRVAVREVTDAARGGISLSRVAVLCGGGEAVLRQLHDQLDAAGIPYNGPSGRTLGDSLAGRGLIAILNLEGCDFRRDEVFALLSAISATVLRYEAPSSERPVLGADLVMAWERVSRRAGVARGVKQWETRLNRYAEQQRKAAQQEFSDPDGVEARADRHRREADRAESLAQFMAQLVHDLSSEPELVTWKSWCKWIRGLIHTYIGDEKARERWPESEQEAAGKIERILDRLAGLGEIERFPWSATFRHTLSSELGAPAGRVERVGHGVLTEKVGATLGMELDRAIFIGMAEGTFPHSPSEDPLLPDRERKAVADDLALLADQVSEQHRQLLATLASTQHSTLVYARGDAQRASEQHPSRWLLDTASALAGHPVNSADLQSWVGGETSSWFEHVPSFSGRVLGAEVPATAQELRLRALVGHHRLDNPILKDDSVLARGAELLAARASKQFTRFDGNLAELDTSTLLDGVVSPTSLETWADCPMRYLFQHVLRVQSFEQPEDLLEISASEKGSLVHRALDIFLAEQLAKGTVPPAEQPWSKQQRNRLQEITIELCNQAEAQGLTGTPVYWQHDRSQILADLDRFLAEDDDQRRYFAVTAFASEMSFGMPEDDLGEVAVALPQGRTVRFRGRADRVDRGSSNQLLVTDYKTGRADSYKGLDQHSQDWDPVMRGTRLQLPVYGLAARALINEPDGPTRTQYWFVTSKERFKTRGYLLHDEVIDRFCEVIGTISSGIDAGVFCDRPQPDRTEGPFSQHCDYCNADRLGTHSRRREWEDMRDQAALAEYRFLAEPPPESEPGAG